ncbi:MAG: hypothetical protein FJ255_09040 [Phycisphaerae bacterium]|nr:hypothetical protein [Phycisphaerae bacterium]
MSPRRRPRVLRIARGTRASRALLGSARARGRSGWRERHASRRVARPAPPARAGRRGAGARHPPEAGARPGAGRSPWTLSRTPARRTGPRRGRWSRAR